jgi:uncharacterized protein with PIN domain
VAAALVEEAEVMTDPQVREQRELLLWTEARLDQLHFTTQGASYRRQVQELLEDIQQEVVAEGVDRNADELREPWVMCPACAASWEVPMNNEMTVCPECDELLGNPYHSGR